MLCVDVCVPVTSNPSSGAVCFVGSRLNLSLRPGAHQIGCADWPGSLRDLTVSVTPAGMTDLHCYVVPRDGDQGLSPASCLYFSVTLSGMTTTSTEGKHLPQSHTLVLKNVSKPSPVILYPQSSLLEVAKVLLSPPPPHPCYCSG